MSGPSQCASSEVGNVILDVQHDRVLKLNGVGKEIWELLCEGRSQDHIVQELGRKYDVSAERLTKDVSTFLTQIQTLGLRPIKAPELKSPKSEPRVHSYHPWYGQALDNKQSTSLRRHVFLAFCGLALFDVVLTLFSLKLLCASVKAWPLWPHSFNDDDIGRICAAVQNACIWYPKKALCLQRSAVTTCLLRMTGVPAQMVFGIREMPFFAHAWVEVDGAVVNDWPKVQQFYSRITEHQQ